MKTSLYLSLPLLLVSTGTQVTQAKWDEDCRRCSDVGNDDFVTPFKYHCDRRVDNTICQEMACRTMPYELTPCNPKCPTLMCRPMGAKYDCPPLNCSSCNKSSSDHACVPQENYCPFVSYDPRCCPAEVECVPDSCTCPPLSDGCTAYSSSVWGENGCRFCLQKCGERVVPRDGQPVADPITPTPSPPEEENDDDTGESDPGNEKEYSCPHKNCRKHNECASDEICTMEPVKFSDCYGAKRDSTKCCMKRECYGERYFKRRRNNKCWNKDKSLCNSTKECKWFSYVKPNGKKESNCREKPSKV